MSIYIPYLCIQFCDDKFYCDGVLGPLQIKKEVEVEVYSMKTLSTDQRGATTPIARRSPIIE